jgi:hypothetical protein
MEMFIYNSNHASLLEKYFVHPLTPQNNRNSKSLKLDVYDGDSGQLFIMVDNDEIVSTFGAIIVTFNDGMRAIKMPHRLHVRKDYSHMHHSFIDQYYEPALYKWIGRTNVRNLMQTVNLGNERAGFVSWKRHARRRKYGIMFLDSLGKEYVCSAWQILPYLIYEKQTWQYCAWTSLDGVLWNPNWRDTADIPDEISAKLDQSFARSAIGGWSI